MILFRKNFKGGEGVINKLYLFKKNDLLIMALPLLFVLMPRPSGENIHFFTYPLIWIILLILVVSLKKQIEFDNHIFKSITVLLSLSFFIALSILSNANDLSFNSFTHIFKPIFFIVILFSSYHFSNLFTLKELERHLLNVAYFLLFVQIIVGVTQLFGITTFSPLYSMDKTRPLGALVRIAGTMYNPNLFAWVIIQIAVIIMLFEDKKVKKLIFIFLSAVLVLLSGSRSLLILFPVVLLFCKFFLEIKSLKLALFRFPKYIIILLSSFLLVYWFLIKYGSYFPYLNQLLLILETKSLSSVNSFDFRTIMWEDALSVAKSKGLIFSLIFGIGPGIINVLDNDYLYGIINYGLIYSLVTLIFYLGASIYFLKSPHIKIKVLGIQYVFFSLLLGYQSDTLNGWNYPVFFMYFLGICLSLLKQNKS
ncbi:hypothetical protein [Siminovitchia fordii]|uniref:hypothetical protein n=1 Tax=Siminovitchia fordii TaxID=254759 RepID=UPI00036EA1EA|nr:hypothetical protein [Siminovitchia fordii]